MGWSTASSTCEASVRSETGGAGVKIVKGQRESGEYFWMRGRVIPLRHPSREILCNSPLGQQNVACTYVRMWVENLGSLLTTLPEGPMGGLNSFLHPCLYLWRLFYVSHEWRRNLDQLSNVILFLILGSFLFFFFPLISYIRPSCAKLVEQRSPGLWLPSRENVDYFGRCTSPGSSAHKQNGSVRGPKVSVMRRQ